MTQRCPTCKSLIRDGYLQHVRACATKSEEARAYYRERHSWPSGPHKYRRGAYEHKEPEDACR